MRKNKILQQNNALLNHSKIKRANQPNKVNFSTIINEAPADILVEVEQVVTVNQTLAKKEGVEEVIASSIRGKVKKIEEAKSKNGVYHLNIEIENNFKKAEALKKLINPKYEELITRLKEANLSHLLEFKTAKNLVINAKDSKYTLSLYATILNTFLSSVLKGSNYLKKAFSLEKISLLVHKKDEVKVVEEINKLNLKNLVVITKKPKDAESISVQDALDFYEAVSSGVICTERMIAVGGLSIKEPSYYTVKLGTPLEELMALCGGLKYTYEEIEDFKEDAMMAVYDEVQIKKEIKEAKTIAEKETLKALLKKKQLEAQETIFKFFEENRKKHSYCLANMVFLEKNKFLPASSLKNAIDFYTDAVLFLSNIEYKNKPKK